MLFAWLKRRRRARIRAVPFPDDWLVHLEKNVGLYALLTEPERQKLRDDLRIFIAETTFEGCGGLEITDEIKVTIAAQASLLLLGFHHDYFERVHTILVYPTGFRSPEGWTAPDGVVHMDVGYLGEAWHHGTVILAWDAALAGGRDPRDGRNVVLHEFAHQLDYLDGVADGVPPLRNRAQYRKWHEVMKAEYDQLVAESEHGEPKLLDAYGATSPVEFFAVATECFFEKPVQMHRRRPQLYEILEEYYCQDTALRFAAEEQPTEERVDARTKLAEGRLKSWRRKPYRRSRKGVRPTKRPTVVLDWPGWVTVWGFDPGWQRGHALPYLYNHFVAMIGMGIALGASYCAYGLDDSNRWYWNGWAAITIVLVAMLSVTAVWLYLAILWIDREKGWAEQQASKGTVPTDPVPPAPETERAAGGQQGIVRECVASPKGKGSEEKDGRET
jgi:Mlc titration factor MtfA (ptsG expression regulator)